MIALLLSLIVCLCCDGCEGQLKVESHPASSRHFVSDERARYHLAFCAGVLWADRPEGTNRGQKPSDAADSCFIADSLEINR